MTPPRRQMRADRRGAAALEFALVFPVVLLFLFGMIAVYTLVAANRAMEYGVEKALRYAVTHGGATNSTINGIYSTAATAVWPDAGANSTVTVSPLPFKAGDTVTVSVSYNWSAPAGIGGSPGTTLFSPVTLTSNASMRVMY